MTNSPSNQSALPFDFNAYFEDVLKSLNLPQDIGVASRAHILELIKEMVNDRIVQVALGMFQEEEFDVMEEMLEKHPEIDIIDAILAISETIPGFQKRLQDELFEMKKEFSYYGDLSQKVNKQDA